MVDISRPKQWPTLSRRELTETGYPVYGANGQIGFSDTYTHADPTVIIGCRGSCGQIHVTVPNSYVTGNAMALDALDTDRVDQSYLVHFLRKRGFDDIVSGSSQPQITRKGLSRLLVPLPSIQEQRRIAAILDKADAIRRKREQALNLTDEFLKSVFLEMFGDPVGNSKGLRTKPLSWFGEIVTGNTPPRSNPRNYGCHIEWIKSDNINTPKHYLTEAKEYLSEEGAKLGRTVPRGSILVICIAGSPASIGRAAIADRDVALNQQINAITPNQDIDQHFLYAQFVVGQRLVQAASTNSMKGMVSKGKFKEIQFLAPEPDEQRKFGEIFHKYLENSTRLLSANNASQDLFSSLSQRAFRGEL
nr:restriction endonuclease subunit S [Ruegeria arenilitoris]